MQAVLLQSRSSCYDVSECARRIHSEDKAYTLIEDGVSVAALARILQRCRREKDPVQASQVHVYMREHGLDTHELLGNYLVAVFAEVGNMAVAQRVFDELSHRRSWSWNPLLVGHVKNGHPQKSLDVYQKMQKNDFEHLNVHAFVALLKACAALRDIQSGLQLHARVSSRCLPETNLFITSILMDMYAKCGALSKARQVFEKSVIRDVVMWTTLIAGHVESGQCEEALGFFDLMQLEGISPNAATYVSCFKACCICGAVEKGHEIHIEMERKGGLSTNKSIGSALVDMYSKFGLVHIAQDVFDLIPSPDVILWTALINGYVENGYGDRALCYFGKMQSEGISPNAGTYVCALKACGSIRAVDMGQAIHVEVDNQGLLQNNPLVGGALLDMYCKCGSLMKAQSVFDNLTVQDVFCWTALIGGYAAHGHAKEAIECYEKMQRLGVSPNRVTILCILKACCSMQEQDTCQKILAEIERHGWLEDPMVMNSAIDVHSKCGSLHKAQEIFDKLPIRDVVSWTALISGYTGHGYETEALQCMEKMQLEGIRPNAITYVCSLKGHSFKEVSEEASKLHAEIEMHGLEKNPFVGNALITMYAKCGLFSIARKILNELPERNVVSWTALLTGYFQHGRSEEAINCYEQMRAEGISPNAVTYVCLLKACSSIGAIDKGLEIHSEIERDGLLDQDVVVGNTLVDLCSGVGAFDMAHQIFKKLHVRNVFSWNALIAGYIKHGYCIEVLQCFEQMQLEGVIPNVMSWLLSVKACGIIGAKGRGQQFHAQMFGAGVAERDVWFGSSLIEMYGKVGSPALARRVFEELPVRDAVSWASLMAAYAECGDLKETLKCFEQMQLEGVPLNCFTLAWCLKLCGAVRVISKGQYLHHAIEKDELYSDPYVCSSLVSMYNRCGSIAKAQEVFNKFPDRNLVSWTSLMTGYMEHGHEEEALTCYDQMQREGVLPNAVTILCCLKACGSLGNIEWGVKLHAEVEKRGLLERGFVGNTLVSMYAKCCSLKAARQVFDRLPVQDVVSWNALMTGYAETGEIENVFSMFHEMLGRGIWPDAITFLVILMVCTRTGQFHRGETFFESMSENYGIVPTIEHYTCVIDLYGRTGEIDKGLTVIRWLPLCPDFVVWRSVLGACKYWGSVKNGQKASAMQY